MNREVLLFHCQHSLGIGHLTRSFALATALMERFRVVFLNGGPLPPGVSVPSGLELVHLPALGMDDGHTLISREGECDVDAARARRRELIVDAVARHRPAVVVVELFPFGRKKFMFELLPMIAAARSQERPARIVCSLRDILVSGRPDQRRHDDRARWLCDRYFDSVLVHSDPAFASLAETFFPSRPLRTPVHYTGFVVPQRAEAGEVLERRGILVSAGGGIVGAPLYSAALAAYRARREHWRMPMRVIAGPFLPDAHWRALQDEAGHSEGVELVRHVPDLAAQMRGARISVSQCGYNSALDIVQSGVPALVVPFGDERENEQRNRAVRMERLGLVRSLETVTPGGAELALALDAMMGFVPSQAAIGLDGARRSTRILAQLVEGRRGVAACSGRRRPVGRIA